MDTLINLSGGLDSTFVLWRHLSTNQTPVLVHHCILKTAANGLRWQRELEAVHKILDWLRSHGLSHFEYIESTVDYRQLGAHPRDNLTIEWMTGVILTNPRYRSIRCTTANTPIEDRARVDRQRVNYAGYLARGRAVRERVWHPRRGKPHPIEVLQPVRAMTKRDIWQATPPELRTLTVSCRYGTNCGRCHSCKQLKGVDR